MLDTTTAHAALLPWTDTLARGDVVLFSYPVSDDGIVKPRPCLVLEVGRVGDHAYAELAYGTSAMTRANVGYEVRVRQPDGIAAAGLREPTRFVCSRRAISSLDSDRFHCSVTYPSPVIGRLDAAGLRRMDVLRARIWAEKDMAAERRNERRGRTEQGVPVIWRSSRGAAMPALEAGR
jgi:hypothetical protein